MTTQTDPYIYSGTNVLINKFGFRSQAELDDAESDFTVLRLAELSLMPSSLLVLKGTLQWKKWKITKLTIPKQKK